MEIILLIIIANLISKAMKAKKEKTDKQQKQSSFDQAFGQGFAPGTYSAPPQKPEPQPKPPVTTQAMMPPRQEGKRQVIQPKVHAHLAPDCDEHDVPGSLNVTSLEGKDACHAEQLAPAAEPRASVQEPQEKPGIQLDWSGENMVRAFVMQEVLTRPCERRRRV